MIIRKKDAIVYSAIPYDNSRNYIQRAAILTILYPNSTKEYLVNHELNLMKYITESLVRSRKSKKYYDDIFIHRLVNEKDLKMLENTMPTLDRNSYQTIPSLGQGETIITGNAMQVPVFIKVDKEEKNRPKSDDIILTKLWTKKD